MSACVGARYFLRNDPRKFKECLFTVPQKCDTHIEEVFVDQLPPDDTVETLSIKWEGAFEFESEMVVHLSHRNHVEYRFYPSDFAGVVVKSGKLVARRALGRYAPKVPICCTSLATINGQRIQSRILLKTSGDIVIYPDGYNRDISPSAHPRTNFPWRQEELCVKAPHFDFVPGDSVALTACTFSVPS